MDSKKADLQQDASHAHTSEGAEFCDLNRPAPDYRIDSQPEELTARPEGRLAELNIQLQQKENEIHSLQQQLSDLEGSATQARIANETLTYYLERYKRVKDRFLPPGSFRERVCRQIAHRILVRPPSGAQPQPTSARVPALIRPGSVARSTTDAETLIEPPPEWCRDLQH